MTTRGKHINTDRRIQKVLLPQLTRHSKHCILSTLDSEQSSSSFKKLTALCINDAVTNLQKYSSIGTPSASHTGGNSTYVRVGCSSKHLWLSQHHALQKFSLQVTHVEACRSQTYRRHLSSQKCTLCLKEQHGLTYTPWQRQQSGKTTPLHNEHVNSRPTASRGGQNAALLTVPGGGWSIAPHYVRLSACALKRYANQKNTKTMSPWNVTHITWHGTHTCSQLCGNMIPEKWLPWSHKNSQLKWQPKITSKAQVWQVFCGGLFWMTAKGICRLYFIDTHTTPLQPSKMLWCTADWVAIRSLPICTVTRWSS